VSRLAEKGTDGLTAKVEKASKTVGTVAGTLHRSFNAANRAGMAEITRSRASGYQGGIARALSPAVKAVGDQLAPPSALLNNPRDVGCGFMDS